MRSPGIQWRIGIIRGLTSWIDRGVDIPAEVLREHIEAGDILEWLPVAVEPPIITLEPLTDTERLAFQRTLEEHHRHDTGGSYGVSRSGLALVVAWLAHDIDRISAGSEPFG